MRITSFLIALLFIAPTTPVFGGGASLGTGEVYSGGDPRGQRLADARERLNEAFVEIEAGAGVDALCTPKFCGPGSDRSLCHILESLSAEQRDACRAFLKEGSARLREANREEATPFVLSASPLTVRTAGGKTRPVSAVTVAGARGPITFHAPTLEQLTPAGLLALLGHELGHKLVVLGRPVDDDSAWGPFRTGREMLDAAGAAVALYAPAIAAPIQPPPSLPAAVGKADACALAGDSSGGELVGRAIDVLGRLPERADLDRWRIAFQTAASRGGIEAARVLTAGQILGSDAARGRWIGDLFHQARIGRPQPEERDALRARLAAGETHESIVAAVLGDTVYADARAITGQDQFVTAVFVDLTGRSPTDAETRASRAALSRVTRATWVLGLLREVPEARAEIVRSWYRRYLNRVPTDQELADHTARLRGGQSWEAAQAALIARPEYTALQRVRWRGCGAPVKGELKKIARSGDRPDS